jgi:hypothetical protein
MTTFSAAAAPVNHRWTATQLAHLKRNAYLPRKQLIASFRHRFGGRVAHLTDTAIRGRCYVLTHRAERAAYAAEYRAQVAA